jgi:hypothetical protein
MSMPDRETIAALEMIRDLSSKGYMVFHEPSVIASLPFVARFKEEKLGAAQNEIEGWQLCEHHLKSTIIQPSDVPEIVTFKKARETMDNIAKVSCTAIDFDTMMDFIDQQEEKNGRP